MKEKLPGYWEKLKFWNVAAHFTAARLPRQKKLTNNSRL
jgi:hypothetical protein